MVPEAGDLPGVKWDAGVEPLDEAAGLVGIVFLGDVLVDEGQGGFGIIIEGDAGEGGRWAVLGFSFKEGDAAGGGRW